MTNTAPYFRRIVVRLGELHQDMHSTEDGRQYIDIAGERYWLEPDDVVIYTSLFEAVRVERAERPGPALEIVEQPVDETDVAS